MHGISDTLTSLLVIRHIGIYHNCQKNITQNTLLFVILTYSTKQANKKNIYIQVHNGEVPEFSQKIK